MLDPDHDASPFRELPAVAVVLALLVLGVEAVLQLAESGILGGAGGIGWRSALVQQIGFYDPLWEHARATGYLGGGILWRPVSYVFVHAAFLDALFAAVLLLALGTQIAKVFPPLSTVFVFVVAALVGAVTHGMLRDTSGPLFGAWPPVYGFLGLFTWSLWITARRTGKNPWAAFQLVGVLVALQILFVLLFGARSALESELAGFAVAFVLAPLLLPGGITRLRARLRSR
ncbi:MAG: rhomboid family intramembrane serine protease [Pseudomonadota bacterium]